MTARFAYVTAANGPFKPDHYNGTSKKNQSVGDVVYVISGNSPRNPQYYLEGLYEIVDFSEQGNMRNINFRPKVQPPRKLLINDLDWFDNQDFHKKFTSGQNFNPIRPEYQDRFDQMLRPSARVDRAPDQSKDDAINDSAGDRPDPRTRTITSYPRDPRVREEVLKRAKGKCEFCGTLGFECEDGGRYLESHHIIRLADDGEDRRTNVIALCPNDHRKAHYGVNRDELEVEMARIVLGLESGAPTPV